MYTNTKLYVLFYFKLYILHYFTSACVINFHVQNLPPNFTLNFKLTIGQEIF